MKQNNKRFAIYPGYVVSANDGQEHLISFRRLCELYGLPVDLCLDMSNPEQRRGMSVEHLIKLSPRKNGDYTLTAEQKGPCPLDTDGDGNCHRCARSGGCRWLKKA